MMSGILVPKLRILGDRPFFYPLSSADEIRPLRRFGNLDVTISMSAVSLFHEPQRVKRSNRRWFTFALNPLIRSWINSPKTLENLRVLPPDTPRNVQNRSKSRSTEPRPSGVFLTRVTHRECPAKMSRVDRPSRRLVRRKGCEAVSGRSFKSTSSTTWMSSTLNVVNLSCGLISWPMRARLLIPLKVFAQKRAALQLAAPGGNVKDGLFNSICCCRCCFHQDLLVAFLVAVEVPDEMSQSLPPHRLFIARDGYWRGYFVMDRGSHGTRRTRPSPGPFCSIQNRGRRPNLFESTCHAACSSSGNKV